mmetsp:Transcript_28809/g.59018  ORF Transcript_28809/g.59018 Transcript_28809/m.59018 type:complete len:209 (-) Transcript_28809:640-1266(-)
MEESQLLRLHDAIRLHHQLVCQLSVALLLEPPLYHRPQLLRLLRCVQHGGRGEAQGHIGHRRLPEHLRGGGEVKDVVDDLVGQTEVVPELLRRQRDVRVDAVAAEDGARLARVADERRGFVVALPQVVRHLESVLRCTLYLHDLALHERVESRRHDLHHIHTLELGEEHRRPRQEVVTRQHCHFVAVHFVDRLATSPRVGLVEHIIVN